jgi:integrase-like protein
MVNTGNFIGPRIERITVAELAEDVVRDYRINGKKSLDAAERRWKLHLKPYFGKFKAAQVGTEIIERYKDHRIQGGAENATINRELAFLKRAFRLGYKATPPKVYRVPAITMLKENNVRKGFLKDEDYDRLATECAKERLWLRAMLAVYHNYGWRKNEPLQKLRVAQVDLLNREIRLEVGDTKNGEGRTVTITDEVYTLLAACVQSKNPDDPVFTREDGKPVKDFRQTWKNVCNRAGVGRMICRQCSKPAPNNETCAACGGGVKYDGLLVHDLRRTGARNLRREGVGEGAIMKIGGWKTASVFRRYDIVSDSDLKEAAQKLNAKRERLKAQREQQQHSTSQQVQNQNDSKLTMIGPSGTAVANSDAVN